MALRDDGKKIGWHRLSGLVVGMGEDWGGQPRSMEKGLFLLNV